MAKPGSGTVSVDGFELGYTTEGEGTSALIVGSDVVYRRSFSLNLRKHLRITFLDHRGFAAMPRKPSERSFELGTILADIEQARQELELGDVVVVGHSGHAIMALEYAKTYPDHVSHVVMIGCSPNLGQAMMAEANRYWEESVDPIRKRVMAENVVRVPDASIEALPYSKSFVKWYIRSGPKFWFDPRYDATGLWEGVEPNEIMQKIWGKDFASIDITRGLEKLAIPVFLALGRYDFSIGPPHTWNEVRPKFQDLTVRMFERSGHTPQLEEAELFDTELLNWLASRN
jgi:proline iminopeptidase